MTLMRTIVCADVARTVHDSGEGSELVDVGIGLASQEAFQADVLADPDNESDFPLRGWIWRCRYRIYGFIANDPAVFNRHIEMDLRGKRKIENGELFLSLVNTAQEGASGTVNIAGIVRCLILST